MGKVAGIQGQAIYKAMRFTMRMRSWLICAVVFMSGLGAGAKAENPNPDWVLVFEDDFSSYSFDGKKLKWGQKWNKIEYITESSLRHLWLVWRICCKEFRT